MASAESASLQRESRGRDPGQGVRGQIPPEAENLLAFGGGVPNGSRKFASFSIFCKLPEPQVIVIRVKKTEGIIHDGIYSTYINRKAVWNCSACDMREMSRDARIVEWHCVKTTPATIMGSSLGDSP